MFLKRLFLLTLVCIVNVCGVSVYATECQQGEYYSDGEGCISCDAGNYCVNDEMKQCESATVSGDGADHCEPCTEDAPYANLEHTQCVACDSSGQYVVDGVCNNCGVGNYVQDNICKECPAGSYCTGNGAKQTCSGNTISDDGASSCTECSGDTPYANSGHTECVVCDDSAKYYIDNGVCKSCALGYYYGKVQGNVEISMGDDVYDCISCPSGAYCLGGSAWQSCPKGSYSTGSASFCIDCPTGYTTNAAGSGSVSACKIVPVTLSFGDDNNISLPNCLTAGKINTGVVKKGSVQTVQNN